MVKVKKPGGLDAEGREGQGTGGAPRDFGFWQFPWSFFGNAGLAPIVPLAPSARALQHLAWQGTQRCPGRAARVVGTLEHLSGASSRWGRAWMVGPQLVRGLARETPVTQAVLCLTGVSLDSVETGLSSVPQGSGSAALPAKGHQAGTAGVVRAWESRLGDVGPLSLRFSLSFLDKLGLVNQVWQRT